MKRTQHLLLTAVAALAVTLNLQAQPSGPSSGSGPLSLYHPLTLAPAEAGSAGGGEAGGQSEEELAKAAQNPIAKLISVPFQNNFNFGIGPNNAVQYVLNVEPVIPFGLSEDWNLITRTVVPTINQPSPAPGIRSAFGLGDINPQFYFSPAKAEKLFWGVGPTFTFPTATDPLLGAGKWSAGPTMVGVFKDGPWVVGALVNNQWSFAGWGDRSVNQMFLEPFINYNLGHGWYLVTAPIMTANWKADSDNRWTVPVGGGLGKVFRLGKMPINSQVGAYYNAVTPKDLGADWQLRFQVQFLFPK